MKRILAVMLAFALVFSAVASVQLFGMGSANPSSMIPPPPPLARIYIRADGNVDPSTALIQRVGNVYTLTANIVDRVIEVQCDNIVIDGAGCSLTGKTYENGVVLAGRKNVSVKNIVVKTFSAGIYVSGCTGCTIDGNTVMNSSRGIEVSEQSRNNLVRGNILKGNMYGVHISHAGGNQFRSNTMEGNKYNLGLEVPPENNPAPIVLSEFINDIDLSNTVDGKPVCYWINQENKIVPSGCGYVALIGCADITVQNLFLSKNGQGVLLISTRDSTITQNTITGNVHGVWADTSSSNINVNGNSVADSTNSGILFASSTNSQIFNNNITGNGWYGIHLSNTEGVKIIGNTVKADSFTGINLVRDLDTTISENYIANHKVGTGGEGAGISLGQTSDATISKNIIENNQMGIGVYDLSKNNLISGNIIRDNYDGLFFHYSSSYGRGIYPTSTNTFRENRLDSNEHNLWFESIYAQDIDNSNTVNGKPICYWVGQHGRAVPSDAGYIALISCVGIRVEGVSISDNGQGILLYDTSNSLITRNRFTNNNGDGVHVESSFNNVFSENEIAANAQNGVWVGDSANNTFVQNYVANNGRVGIGLGGAHDSTIIRNNVTSNKEAGIELNSSKNNTITENYVARNDPGILLIWGTSQTKVIANTLTENIRWGLRIEGSKINRTIHHNNFINNKVNQSLQVSIPWPADANVWDDGKEGNYWSDYQSRYPNASEQSSTGIGNTPFFINENNMDRFPLLVPVAIPGVPACPLEPAGKSSQQQGNAASNNSTSPNQQNDNSVKTGLPINQTCAIAWALAIAGVLAVSIAVLVRRKLKPKT